MTTVNASVLEGCGLACETQERTIAEASGRWNRHGYKTGAVLVWDNTRRYAMSVRATPQSSTSATYEEVLYEDDRGYGWVVFAGVMLLLLGTINTIEGIAAIGNAHFFVANTQYIAGDLNAWGWTVLCLGVLQLAVGCGVFVKNQFSRWTGIVVLSLNAIAQLFMMPAYPFWSLCIFAGDVLAIYGLAAHGKRIGA
jgi:hypothetical protein